MKAGRGRGAGAFGALIRERRMARGMTQSELAAEAGVTVGALRDLEQGRVLVPRPAAARRLADALGLGERESQQANGVGRGRRPGGRAGLRVGVLGPVALSRGGEDLPPLSPGPRAVLALLVLAGGGPVRREAVIDVLWGQEPPPSAAGVFHTYMSQLRSLLDQPSQRDRERVLLRGASGYCLRLAAGQLDLLDFRDLIGRAREAAGAGGMVAAGDLYRRALALWRGEPFADVDALSGHPAVVGLADERVEVTLEYASLVSGAGMHAGVLPYLKALAVGRPLDERLHAALMIALAGGGRQAEALHVFDGLRRRLDDELGVLPGVELRAAHERVLRQEVRPAEPGAGWRGVHRFPAVPVPAQLPADIGDFTGREPQVRHLCDMLASDDAASSPGAVRVAVVAGAGGLGKTTLAVHTAHQVRRSFPEGQLYVDLLGATAQSAAPGEVLARFLRDLGVDGDKVPASDEERAALYRTTLTGRQMLIVLDNARDAAQVRPLLPGTASCAVLVTTRNRMPDLTSTRFFDLNVLAGTEALALFARIVGDDRPETEPDATTEVLLACAGLPLAIRICAARLAARRQWKIATMANRLRDEQRRLDELQAGDLAVRASFQVSYASLQAGRHGIDQARVFRLLGLWEGTSISLPAAAVLLGQSEEDVAYALEALVDVNLLESSAADRYHFHDLLRVYAAERVAAEEPESERNGAIRRLLSWYLKTADDAVQVISPHRYHISPGNVEDTLPSLGLSSVDEALAWYDSERANLLAAARQAYSSGMYDTAWRMPAALFSVFIRRDNLADSVTAHRIALDSARKAGHRQGEGWVLHNLGSSLARMRDREGIGHLEEALAIRREIGDRTGEAQALLNIADAYYQLHGPDAALEHMLRALEVLREEGPSYRHGIILNNLGEAYLDLGRLDEAVRAFEEARAIFTDIDSVNSEGYSLQHLGRVYLELGRRDDALDCLREAIAQHRSTGDHLAEAIDLKFLGRAQHTNGEVGEARESWIAALAIFTRLGEIGHVAEIESVLRSL